MNIIARSLHEPLGTVELVGGRLFDIVHAVHQAVVMMSD